MKPGAVGTGIPKGLAQGLHLRGSARVTDIGSEIQTEVDRESVRERERVRDIQQERECEIEVRCVTHRSNRAATTAPTTTTIYGLSPHILQSGTCAQWTPFESARPPPSRHTTQHIVEVQD